MANAFMDRNVYKICVKIYAIQVCVEMKYCRPATTLYLFRLFQTNLTDQWYQML